MIKIGSKNILKQIDSELQRIGLDTTVLNNKKFKYLSPQQRTVFERVSQDQFDKLVKDMDELIAKAKEEDVGLKEFEKNIGKVEFYIYDISNIFIGVGDVIAVCNICTFEIAPSFIFCFLDNTGIDSDEYGFCDYSSLLRNYKRSIKCD